eukprot:2508361-Alexandrium_andersonii.AAC.1
MRAPRSGRPRARTRPCCNPLHRPPQLLPPCLRCPREASARCVKRRTRRPPRRPRVRSSA